MKLLLLALALASSEELSLSRLADKHWDTGISVVAAGAKVRIAAGQLPEGHYFVVAPEGGTPQLYDVYDFLNWRTIEINGEPFQLSAALKTGMIVDTMNVVGRGSAARFTAERILELSYEAGADVVLQGRRFKFICGRRPARGPEGLTLGGRFAALVSREGGPLRQWELPLERLPAALTIDGLTVRAKLDGDVLSLD